MVRVRIKVRVRVKVRVKIRVRVWVRGNVRDKVCVRVRGSVYIRHLFSMRAIGHSDKDGLGVLAYRVKVRVMVRVRG